MRRSGFTRLFRLWIACSFCFVLSRAFAQDEVAEGEFIENTIVGRNIAFRLSAETQFTEDDDELIGQDIKYAQFPTRLHQAEAKLYQSDGANFTATYALWKNDQGLDMSSWSWRMRIPVTTTDFTDFTDMPPHLNLGYRRQEGAGGNPAMNYLYAGYDKFLTKALFFSGQYSYVSSEGQFYGHQLTEYVSWKPSNRWRIGENAGISKKEGADDLTPWYARLFGAVFLVEKLTALRLEARHYQASEDLSFQDYNAYLYQKIGSRSVVRFNYRFYHDSEDLYSNAVGVKFKHYFSARLWAYAGYRYYDHSTGTDFDTFFAGIGMLL